MWFNDISSFSVIFAYFLDDKIIRKWIFKGKMHFSGFYKWFKRILDNFLGIFPIFISIFRSFIVAKGLNIIFQPQKVAGIHLQLFFLKVSVQGLPDRDTCHDLVRPKFELKLEDKRATWRSVIRSKKGICSALNGRRLP